MDIRIEILNKLSITSKPITSSELANSLGISKQSVKNHIKYINDIDSIIMSTKNGYLISNLSNVSHIIYTIMKETRFNDENNRKTLLLEKVLTSSHPINYYSFSQEHFISDSTFNNDFAKINNYLQQFDCKLYRKKGYILFSGNEKQRRKIINSLFTINSYTADQVLKYICKQSNLDIEFITKHSKQFFKIMNIHVSDYSLRNFVQHLIIIMSRNKNRKQLQSSNKIVSHEFDITAISRFLSILEKHYNLEFTLTDIKEIYDLITVISPTNKTDCKQDETVKLKNIVSSFTFNLINDIKQIYCIDLFNEEFKKYFDSHLSNAIIRAKNGDILSNPLTSSIYIKNPLIYDIAVFIAMKVNKEFNITLPQDEITYLALHVGGSINLDFNNKKVKAFLKTEFYHLNTEKLITQLNDNFSNFLIIVGYGNKLPPHIKNIDLIIDSSSNVTEILNIPKIKISPLINNQDINNINVFISKIQRKKTIKLRKHQFNSIFSKKYFEHNHYEKTPIDMINYISDKAFKLNLVDKHFSRSVLQRESITPTSFDNRIAIPHSIIDRSNQTFAYVISNDKAMRWGYFDVNIVILIGISKNDNQKFREIYSSLLNIIANDKTISKIIKSKKYEDFLNTLIYS